VNEQIKENRERWCAALRSGEYTQGAGALRTDEGFCCLGVAANELNPNGWEFSDEHSTWAHDDAYHELGEAKTLSDNFAMTMFGLDPAVQSRLSGKNDNGDTFEEIAIMIEALPIVESHSGF
jgi:hypothetical protein